MVAKHKGMNINPMSNSAVNVSVGKSLVKAARWEARGQAHLAEGRWAKALDAFERKLWWIKFANVTRENGTVWRKPANTSNASFGNVPGDSLVNETANAPV